ncbi:MAG: hypothetical protein LBT60_01095 [Oscillospiraceae bacterium]|jgi:DNA-directed RNA polymerase subunit K/omega|nr:hypothetical protein [Oscillospiraceae bacterium]
MANGVEDLLTMLYNMVQDAFSLPFGADRCILDRDKVLALIDEINNILPGDLKQARSIVEARNEVVNTAKREADAIKRQAADRARQLVSQEEVLVVARQKAGDIVQAAENKARDLRRTANEYVDNALKRAEETLGAALTEMRSSRAEFRTASDKRDPG